MMLNAYQRKKEPEVVRQRILESAVQLATENGVAGMSIQAVATMAGVSKGGVFHHFANKQLLIETMLTEVIRKLDFEIEALFQVDATAYGSFTRAYIETTLTSESFGMQSLWGALTMTLITDRTFSQLWTGWMHDRLQRHAATDSDMNLSILRYAADGVWFVTALDPYNISEQSDELQIMKNELINRSYGTIK